MRQRPQQLMAQFAKHGWHVYYANQKQQPGKPPTKIMENLEVIHDWPVFLKNMPHIDVLWISCAVHKDLAVAADITVFDSLDDFDAWSPYEPGMLAKSDLVFTSSEVLHKKQSARHHNVVMLKNACDPEFIRPRSDLVVPQELKNLKKPIVGFIGAVGSWVNTFLLAAVGSYYSTVVIGPPFGKQPPLNVLNVGMKDYYQLPQYYNAIDIGIIPFCLNKVSIAANPIKMYEYLAAGKPVVTTNLPECRHYPGAVFPSASLHHFIENIKKATMVDSTVARKIALENSWEQRFIVAEAAILKVLNE